MEKVLFIMGPTASGKSALAIALAQRHGAAIVNADSMQVYRDLRVLTARPTVQEEALAEHRLFGFVDASIRFSVGAWSRAAAAVLAELDGRPAIFCGGTGLYFRALTEGLAAVPDIPEAVRKRLAQDLAAEGAPALHARLAALDPAGAAKLSAQDAPRIVRALEVLETTGETLASFHEATRPLLAPGSWTGVCLTPDRDALYARIDARFDAMLKAGVLEEARALAARGLDPLLPAMKAHGMPWLAAHCRGEMDLAEAVALAKRDTRRYAKRQFTWMAHQTPTWPRVVAEDMKERTTFVSSLIPVLD